MLKNHLNNQKGMTLIEITIVLIIIGGLFAVVAPRIFGASDKAKYELAKTLIRNIGDKLEVYSQDCGSVPSSDEGLKALIEKPSSCENWGPEPYLKKIPQDPWNSELVYESSSGKYTIKSLGKDKQDGGEGLGKDISSEDL